VKKNLQILFGLFLFAFPLSIRHLVVEQNSYRFGNFNPWVSGFIYLPEIFLFVSFGLWAYQKAKNKETIHFANRLLWTLFALFVANSFLVTFLFGDPILGALFVLRIFEGLIVFWLLTDKVLLPQRAVTILLLGALFQIVWGYLQWRLNHSLGLMRLGESIIGPDVLGVAKIDLPNGLKQIRAYGSFLHPNILAGYLLTILFIALDYLRRRQVLLWLPLFIWGIYLTHSRSAMLVGTVGLIIYFLFRSFKTLSFRKSVALAVGLTLAVANTWFFLNYSIVRTLDPSWTERLSQIGISETLFSKHPFGVGDSNFTLEMEKVSPQKLLPWDFQPVHNTYYLILNEVGIQGFLLILSLIILLLWRGWKTANPIPLFVLLLLAPFDHYLWDSFAGMMMVALVAGFFYLENQPKAQ
jgi:hypothetical protein